MKYTQFKGGKGDFFQKCMEQKQPSGYFFCFCLRSTGSLKILIGRSNSAETEPEMNILTSQLAKIRRFCRTVLQVFSVAMS